MRVRALLAGDVRTQYKYGFYLLYLFLSMFYIGLLLRPSRGLAGKGGDPDDFFRPGRHGALLYGRHRTV
jgi:hypothetical protein